jgi:hypothetical protein
MANPTARIFALAAAMVDAPEFAVVVSVARVGRTLVVFTQRAVGKSRNVDD